MPRVRLAAEKYAVDDLRRLMRYLTADVTNEEIAAALGVSKHTASNRRNDPEQLRVSELRKLAGAVRMTGEDKDRLRKLLIP